MELSQLRTLLRVTEEGSFSRAAITLHLTQPAVSQQIRALEAELGVGLLRRAGRTVLPTKAGETLLESARAIMAAAERAQIALDEYRTERRRQLTIGGGNTTITFRLPALLREYRRRNTAVEVVVRAGNSDALLALLSQGALDLALVTSPADQSDLVQAPLFSDEVVLILPRDHPLGQASSLGPADLAGIPSILFTRGSGFRRFLDTAFTRANYQPPVVMEVDSIEGIKGLVQAGLGLSFLPRVAVQQELASGELRTLPVAGLAPMHRKTYAVFRSDQYMSSPLQSFLSLLAETFPDSACLLIQNRTRSRENERPNAGVT